MAFFEKKSPEDNISRVTPGYEETERQTPKAGYVLLLAMFAAALFFGWRAISDLQDVPTKPESLSSCASGFITYSSWEDFGIFRYHQPYAYEPPRLLSIAEKAAPEKPKCVFSGFEKMHGIPAIYEQYDLKNEELNQQRNNLGQTTADIANYENQYSLSLQEIVAGAESPIYLAPEIRQKILALRDRQNAVSQKIAVLEADTKPLDNQLRSLYADVMRDYRRAWRWYEFKVFLLEVLFVIPFFFLVLWGYFRLLAKNSPYTIIFTALLGVASVLFLRVFLVWFWGLFLARVIQTIWEYIQNFALLKSLIFYGGMILSIAVFGGAVYLLQKRIFDPHRVALRRLRDKQCPNCRMPLEVGGQFCPNCGRKLKEICAKCGKERWADFPACPHCGFKHES